MSDPAPILLDLADARDPALVGGKAVNLHRLIAAGLPVPDGFVVTTAAYRSAHERGGDAPDVPADLEEAIREAYARLGSPPVAVRSSATAEDLPEASMAGQFETILNVAGAEALRAAVRRCWAAVDSPRTRAYFRERGIDAADVAMAVVVQRLVAAEAAGVLFTVNPRGGDDEMLIEAAWGLGEAIVSGRVQPDLVRVDRATGEIVETRIADKHVWIPPGGEAEPVPEDRRREACLAPDAVATLVDLGRRAEAHFGAPQDMEWAVAGGEVFVLQSRPITTLGRAEAYEALLERTRSHLRGHAADGRGPWVLHNIAETLPHPTPLTWSVIGRFMSGAGGFGEMYRLAGYRPSDRARRDGFLERIAGRPYMDAALAPEMFGADFPFAYDPERLRREPDASQSPPTVPAGSLWARRRAARLVAKANGRLHDLAADLDRTLREETIPAFVAWCEAERGRDLTSLSVEAWADLWRDCERRVLDEFAPRALLPSLVCGMAMADLRALLEECFWDDDPDDLLDVLAAAPEPDKTLDLTAGLYDVAHGRRTPKDWLAAHGHRGPSEFDLAAPRWRERPDEVRTMADRLRDGPDPRERHRERYREAEACLERLAARLPGKDARRLRRRLDLVRRYLPFREDGKYYLILGCDLLRDLALEAGRRLGIGDAVFLLTFEEVQGALAAGSADAGLLAARRAEREAEARLSPPHFIDAGTVETLGAPSAVACEGRCEAQPVSHGLAAGPARIVRAPDEAGDLGTGYVLVCPSTDPAWTPLFVGAAGLVLEQGGTLSHGAIVAREMGIPAVVLPGATSVFRDGETLTVDGHHGAVVRAEPGEAAQAPEGEADAVAEASPDPQDTRIDRSRIPPPPGRRERTAARLRNGFALAWAAYLVAAFALPAAWLYDPSLRVLDAALWPAVASLGRPATVALLAVALAAATMVGQRLLTDNRRLAEAKRRAALLAKEAADLPKDSPRRKTITHLTAPVQTRSVLASFVPLAVLLGPLLMSIMWLADRMDPAAWNPDPGSPLNVVATVDGDFREPLTLDVEGGLALDASSPATRRLPPIREVLEAHADVLTDPERLASLPESVRTAAERAREHGPLQAYLAGGIPPQRMAWQVRSPEEEGRFHMALHAGGAPPLAVDVVLGDADPPAASRATGGDGSPIEALEVVAPRSDRKRVFWAPLAPVGMQWDTGWLAPYLVAYIAAMVVIRRALRLA
ncbi:MAG: PEP/pyruvate-binding domain-containing protein [Phycisphaerae bacterium]